jgi:hypothetical protein
VGRNSGDGLWCFLGDFNTIGRVDERRGVNRELSSSQREELNFYSHFVTEVEMEDLNVLGRRFTWYHPN